MLNLNTKKGKQQLEEFCRMICRLSPVELMGVANILSVNIFEEDGKTAREGNDIINNIVDNFTIQGRKERRTMMVILTERNKHREKRG